MTPYSPGPTLIGRNPRQRFGDPGGSILRRSACCWACHTLPDRLLCRIQRRVSDDTFPASVGLARREPGRGILSREADPLYLKGSRFVIGFYFLGLGLSGVVVDWRCPVDQSV